MAAPRQSVVWELLLREGRAAELGGELRRARELFSACHALSARPEARLLAASMRLKLGEAEAALAEYALCLSSANLGERTRAVVLRKREEAEAARLGVPGRRESSETLQRNATSGRVAV